MQCSRSCSLGVPALPPSPFICQFLGELPPVQAGEDNDLWHSVGRHGVAVAGRASGQTDGEHLHEHLHDPVSCPACSSPRATLSASELVAKRANHVQSCRRHNFAPSCGAQRSPSNTISSCHPFPTYDCTSAPIPGELRVWPSRLSPSHRRSAFLRLFCVEASDLNKVKDLDYTISTQCQGKKS